MRSLEPGDTVTAGRREMVIVTPATDTMEFDKVICVKACQMSINAKQNNAYPRLLWSQGLLQNCRKPESALNVER